MDPVTPRAIEGLRMEIMDGETVLYEEHSKKMIYLNESATVVFQLCDGHRTVREIIEALTAAYPDASASIAEDIITVIEYLVQEGAIRLERSRQ